MPAAPVPQPVLLPPAPLPAVPTAAPKPSHPAPVPSSPSGTPRAGAAGRLIAVVTADRAYYDSQQVGEVLFPVGAPPRTIELPAGPATIGRRSRTLGTEPAIDLAVPPEDPAVSHIHASLLPSDDGTWTVVDHGSTNGTYLNESPEPLTANVPPNSSRRSDLRRCLDPHHPGAALVAVREGLTDATTGQASPEPRTPRGWAARGQDRDRPDTATAAVELRLG